MAGFGDVLRRMGSVLNPQVAQELAQEERAKDAQQNQLGMFALQQHLQKMSPEYQAREEALKNERSFREAVKGAGGDMTKVAEAAVSYGKPELALSLYNQQEARTARLQQARDALEGRRHEVELRLADKALDRAQREQFQASLEALKQQSLALQGELARGNQDLRRLQLIQAGQGQLDKKVTSFANELQQNKIPALSASITTANDILKDYEDAEIPGLGLLTGSKRIPESLRTPEAKKVRSALQAVSNDLLNLYSGLAVTLPEAERRELEEMKNGDFTSEDFKAAWPRIVKRYNTVVGNLSAGAGPEVTKEYQSRPGAMKLDPLAAAFANRGTGVPTVKSDEDYNKLPTGAEYIAPDGSRRKKK
jgi:hypothetical protein